MYTMSRNNDNFQFTFFFVMRLNKISEIEFAMFVAFVLFVNRIFHHKDSICTKGTCPQCCSKIKHE